MFSVTMLWPSILAYQQQQHLLPAHYGALIDTLRVMQLLCNLQHKDGARMMGVWVVLDCADAGVELSQVMAKI